MDSPSSSSSPSPSSSSSSSSSSSPSKSFRTSAPKPPACAPLLLMMEDANTIDEAILRRAETTTAYEHDLVFEEQQIEYNPRIGKTFFDEANKQLLVANASHVYTISFDPTVAIEFPLIKYINPDFIKVCGLKRSPNDTFGGKFDPYLGIMVNEYQIEFTNLRSRKAFLKTTPKESKQKILTFLWTSFHNIVLVTTTGVELYQYSISQGMKLIKKNEFNILSYVHSPEHRLLLCLTNEQSLQPFHFSGEGLLTKLPKISLSDYREKLNSFTIQIFKVYNGIFVGILRADAQCLSLYKLEFGSGGVAIALNKWKTDLHIPNCRRVSVHVVDNLVVAHDVSSEHTYLFDVKQSGAAICRPRRPAITSAPNDVLYSNSWNFLPGDYALEMMSGKLFRLKIDLEAVNSHFLDKRAALVPFLLRRKESSAILMREIRRSVQMRASLAYLSEVFDQVNRALSIYAKSKRVQSFPGVKMTRRVVSPKTESRRPKASREEEQDRPSSPLQVRVKAPDAPEPEEPEIVIPSADPMDGFIEKRNIKGELVIDQTDMYSRVLFTDNDMDSKFLVSVVIEYIRSLNFRHITPKHFLYELVIDCCVRNERYYQLHQFIQYHVVTDSVHVACQLLSLEHVYPPAYQLALDMFKRLKSNEQIIEVLLSRNDVLGALNICRAQGIRTFNNVRFLEVAQESGNELQFYLVYKYFQKRREIPKARKQVPAHLLKFYDYFYECFPDEDAGVEVAPERNVFLFGNPF